MRAGELLCEQLVAVLTSQGDSLKSRIGDQIADLLQENSIENITGANNSLILPDKSFDELFTTYQSEILGHIAKVLGNLLEINPEDTNLEELSVLSRVIFNAIVNSNLEQLILSMSGITDTGESIRVRITTRSPRHLKKFKGRKEPQESRISFNYTQKSKGITRFQALGKAAIARNSFIERKIKNKTEIDEVTPNKKVLQQLKEKGLVVEKDFGGKSYFFLARMYYRHVSGEQVSSRNLVVEIRKTGKVIFNASRSTEKHGLSQAYISIVDKLVQNQKVAGTPLSDEEVIELEKIERNLLFLG